MMAYAGSLYIGTKLTGTPHFNFLITTMPSVPSNFLYLILPDRLGRRNTLILCELAIGNYIIHTFISRHLMSFFKLFNQLGATTFHISEIQTNNNFSQ